ncbi:MAG: DUF4350 domain-containing protein [Sphingobacteriales bacterium]|nr:MAG: DUF4350 domain-containing protein [Sphingobacteriales bacterium]
MKKYHYILLLLLISLFSSCAKKKEKTDWNIRYSATATAPYGFKIFNDAIPKLFPGAKVNAVPVSNRAFNNYNSEKSVYIVLAEKLYYNEQELWALQQWLFSGNDIVLIGDEFGTELSDFLYLGKPKYWSEEDNIIATSAQLNEVAAPVKAKLHTYSGFGTVTRDYEFEMYKQNLFPWGFKIDSNSTGSVADTLKKVMQVISSVEGGLANAVMFQVGTGRLILVNSPLAFSNYALLQKNNYHYLEDVLSYVHPEVTRVYYGTGSVRANDHSNWSVIWQNKTTRTAILLALLGVVTYVLVNLRRKQNIVPVIKPLSNESKSFVETIASLYYNKRNNRNLALKMIQHLFENIRTHYKLNTSELDAKFCEKLSLRSGNGLAETNALIYKIQSILEDTVIVDDKYLHSLYVSIQQFIQK